MLRRLNCYLIMIWDLFKWKKLGKKYELEKVQMVTDEDLKKAKDILGIS